MSSDQDRTPSTQSNRNQPTRRSQEPLRQDNIPFGQVPASELRRRLASALRADLSAMQASSTSPLTLRTPPGVNRRDDDRGMGA